jgi:hypothetical protein
MAAENSAIAQKGSIGVQEDSQEHAAFAAYVAGKGPCPIDIDELDMTDVREGQAFLEKTILPGKADIKFPKLSPADAKHFISLSKGNFSEDDLKFTDKYFDSMIGKNISQYTDNMLKNDIYAGMSDKGKTAPADLFYIDGRNIQDVMKDKYKSFDILKEQDRERLMKAEILAAATSGRNHVQMGSVMQDGEKKYVPIVTEVNLDLSPLNGFEGHRQKSREMLAQSMLSNDTDYQKRSDAIKRNVSEKIYKAQIALANKKGGGIQSRQGC